MKRESYSSWSNDDYDLHFFSIKIDFIKIKIGGFETIFYSYI